MAGAADDSVDGDEAAPGTDGDAVVARADGRTGDVDVFAPVDVDAVGGWLGSYGGEDSPDDISRGMFAGEVGVPRLNNLLKKYDLPATWLTYALRLAHQGMYNA